MILALSSRLSVKVTITSSAPSTTCALVMMKPSAVSTKPEPTPRGTSRSSCGALLRGGVLPRGTPGMLGTRSPKKRLKNSCISSSIPSKPPPPARDDTLDTVRIFTTLGPLASARSAKSGKPRTAGALCAALVAGKSATLVKPATASMLASTVEENKEESLDFIGGMGRKN